MKKIMKNKIISKSLKDILTEDNKHFIINGLYFGYPSCCIKSFIEGLSLLYSSNRFTYSQSLFMDGSGFIPCHGCSVKMIKKDLIKKDLIKNRIHIEEYPNDFSYMNSEEWKKHYQIIKKMYIC